MSSDALPESLRCHAAPPSASEVRRATGVGAIAILLWSTAALLTSMSSAMPPLQLVAVTFGLAFLTGSTIAAVRGRSVLSAMRQPPPVWLALLALMALRALIGAFYAAMPTVSAARIADITAPDQRGAMMARLGAANGLGMVLGPAIGGLLVKDSLTLPLYIAAALPLLGTLWLAAKLPSDAAHEPRATPPLKLSDRRLRLPLAAMLLAMSAVITAQMIVGFYAMDALRQAPGPAARTAGWAMSTVGVMLILVQVGLAKARRMNAARCLAGGALLSGIGFLLVPALGGTAGLVACYAVMAAGMGLVFPSIQTLAANAVTADEQGIAAGSVIAVQGMAMVVAPLVCTLLYGVRPWMPYVVAASLLLLVALAATLKPRVAAP